MAAEKSVRGEPVESRAEPRAHVAVLLAAGSSTRLGRPKQLLTRLGEPLVHAIARELLATHPRELVVILGARARDVAAALGALPHRALTNPDFADGLSTSLQCAANALRDGNSPVLIAACDQPALDVAHLERLLAAASASPTQCAATAHGTRLGIPALVPGYVFQQSHALHGDHGLGGWLSATEGVACVDNPDLALDIDTQVDVERAVASGWLDVGE